MIVPSFFTATAYRSEAFSGSLLHTNDSPTTASILLIYTWQPRIPFENLFHSSYFLRTFLPPALACLSLRAHATRKPFTLLQMLCCKIFVLKYFRRTPTLRKIFNTKIFPTKISYNENFPFYSICVSEGKTAQDVGLLWCHSHLVWLVLVLRL